MPPSNNYAPNWNEIMIRTGKDGAILFSIYGSEVLHGGTQAGIVRERIYPENSGSLTRLDGCSYLFKGYPSGIIMRQLNISKDCGWMMASFFKNKALILLSILTFIFFRRIAIKNFIRLCENYFKLAYEPLKNQDFIPKEHEWCVSVRELYRMSEVLLGEVKDLKEILGKFRDIALLILEMDTAYRFVMQDILPEVNLDSLRKSPREEINRLFDLMIQRERPGDQRNKWIRIKRAVMIALRIRKIRKLFVRFFLGLDYEKIKLDEADWYFVLGHHCYNYQDISYEDRLLERERIDREKGHKIPRLSLVKEPQPHIEVVGMGL